MAGMPAVRRGDRGLAGQRLRVRAHAGVFVTRLPAPVTLADYLKKIAGRKTVLEQVRQKPDQDFPRAWSVVHNPIQDFGPMMLSLANDNRKFIALREGGILFDQYDRPDDPRAAFPGTIYEIAFNLPWQCVPTFGGGKELGHAASSRRMVADARDDRRRSFRLSIGRRPMLRP